MPEEPAPAAEPERVHRLHGATEHEHPPEEQHGGQGHDPRGAERDRTEDDRGDSEDDAHYPVPAELLRSSRVELDHGGPHCQAGESAASGSFAGSKSASGMSAP